MAKYHVQVTFTYTVDVECRNEGVALYAATTYVGDEGDLSTPEDWLRDEFIIRNVRAVGSDASILDGPPGKEEDAD